MPNLQSPDILSFNGNPVVKYKDTYFSVIACLFAAHLLVAYGETISFFQMLLMPYYYYALIPSFLIAFILFNIIRAINIRLDKHFDWTTQTLQRAGTQVFFGLLIPAFCAFLLAAAYFAIRSRNIFTTTYLKYDFVLILVQLLLLNVYYIAYHFYLRWSQAQTIISALESTAPKQVAPGQQTFQVSKGAKNILLSVDEIAYFFREGDSNYLRTVSAEDYFISRSLDDIQQQLPDELFFRANRQLIVHRQACKGFSLLTYGKLEANITPPFKDAIISQKRARDFKEWLEKP